MNDLGTVYIGLVTYNSAADLPACLAALRAQTYPRIVITVCDNASADDTLAWLRTHAPEVLAIAGEGNVGFGSGHNTILRSLTLTPADCYLTLNPDCRLSPNYCADIVAAIRAHDAGFGVGKLLLADADGASLGAIYSAGHGVRRDGYVVNIGERMADDGAFDAPREIMFGSGAALLLSGRLLAALAPDGELFEPAFFMYGEDVDVGWRARRAGFRCWYVPTATALHRGGVQSPRTRADALANLYLSTIKNADALDLWTLNLWVMVAGIMARLILTPRLGWRLLRRVVSGAPNAWRRRTPAVVSPAELRRWYAWSAAQPTTHAVGWLDRLRRYLAGRGRARQV